MAIRRLRAATAGALSILLLASAVRAAPADTAAMSARVDELIAARWKDAGVEPAPSASDAEFMRRAFLDLTGRIPSVSEVRAFLNDQRDDKRARLIDDLLGRPTHATHLAATWRQFLLPDGANVQRFGGTNGFENWLREQFADNVAYNRMVVRLLLAKGRANDNGPALFYTSLELKPERIAAATSRALLAVQIQCAQCHDHPFDAWTQKDFWGYAAFFARLSRPNGNRGAVFTVDDASKGEVTLPDTKTVIKPRFLGAEQPTRDRRDLTRREQLSDWLTSRRNPYFARAAVNRVWAHLFGRGLVDPVDDMGKHNPASHPELLDELADYFVRSKYDLRQLFRTLANTQAYQRSSVTPPGGYASADLYASMAIKTLSAEQLYDCLLQATGRREGTVGQAGASGFNRGYNQSRQAFVNKFRAPAANPTEYQGGIPQALTLMNGQLVSQATDIENSDLLVALQAPFFTDEQRVEALFLSALSRMPSEARRQKLVAYVKSKQTDQARRQALADVLWALLNSAEFTLNH